MRKPILFCCALVMACVCVIGCKVKGEVEPDGHVSSGVALPQ